MRFFFNRSNSLIQRASFWGLVLFLMSPQAKAMPEKDTGNLGEIRQSILSLRDFQKIYGEGWVALDGRNITESDLHRERLWKGNHLPDARGDFLRCFDDAGRQDGRGNPSGALPIGTYQPDDNRIHNHPIRLEYGLRVCQPELPPGSQWNLVNGNGTYGHIDASQAIGPTGGPESRPRCIIVSTFIKINRTQEDLKTEAILGELKNLPTLLIQDRALLKVLDAYIKNAVQTQLQSSSRSSKGEKK